MSIIFKKVGGAKYAFLRSVAEFRIILAIWGWDMGMSGGIVEIYVEMCG